MKLFALVCRLLLGAMFVFFGLNGIFQFLHMPPPTGVAAEFIGVLIASHYMSMVFLLMILSGVLFLFGRFVPLALVLLGPVLVNILFFHIFISHAGSQAGVLGTLLWLVVYWHHRSAFAAIFKARA